jgi:uncharacterized protein with HEPN domain
MRSADDLLEHMRQAVADARLFVEGMSKEEFLADKRTQQAVVMSLIIVGEAAARLMDQYEETVSRYPLVPWRNIRGMRNRIAHGYFEIDFSIVWDTVQAALPELMAALSV